MTHLQKFVFINEHVELLLAFDRHSGSYEVPSTRLIKGAMAFKQYLDEFIALIGVGYHADKLGGIFTYSYSGLDALYIRPYFVIDVQGRGKVSTMGQGAYRWFSLDDAKAEIKYPGSALIIEKIVAHPEKTWAATIEIQANNESDIECVSTFRMAKEFHPLG